MGELAITISGRETIQRSNWSSQCKDTEFILIKKIPDQYEGVRDCLYLTKDKQGLCLSVLQIYRKKERPANFSTGLSKILLFTQKQLDRITIAVDTRFEF
jgi:hypothetical protein